MINSKNFNNMIIKLKNIKEIEKKVANMYTFDKYIKINNI